MGDIVSSPNFEFRLVISGHIINFQNFIGSSILQGDHGTGKTGKTRNLVLTFSRQGKHGEFCSDTGKNLLTQGKYLDCDY